MSILITTQWINNVGGTSCSCACRDLKEHWIKYANQDWPHFCSVLGCSNAATKASHVHNPSYRSDQVVPLCNYHACDPNNLTLKLGCTAVSTNSEEYLCY